jgi:hypothetical protein
MLFISDISMPISKTFVSRCSTRGTTCVLPQSVIAQSHLNCIARSVREQLTQEVTMLRIVAAGATALFVPA